MAEKKFKPGDVVELPSGSPLMTVSHYDDWGNVVCSWYNVRTNEMHPGVVFNEGALKIADKRGDIAF